jgi:dsDNA-specific endonuclease/ATPase MutS2
MANIGVSVYDFFPMSPNKSNAGQTDSGHETVVSMVVDGVLDLHTFNPREIGDLVPEYLEACRKKGIGEVRIIHGKGIGNLMRTVHSILSKHPGVERFGLASALYGGMGATVVVLKINPLDKK